MESTALVFSLAGLTAFVAPSIALAGGASLPQGGTVVVGSATIAQPNASNLNISTATQSTAITWHSFSIGAGNTVTITQPNASARTFNEVTGGDPSAIYGSLKSNGQVILANPNGIWFAPGSQVNVASIVASTATASQAALAAFAQGKALQLDVPGNANASVVNEGTISVADEGLAALVAPGVANNGVIAAHLGQVVLASGTTATLDFYGDGLISFAVGGSVTALAVDHTGHALSAAVVNAGTISASGGTVLLTAAAAKAVVDNTINMSGVIEAKAVSQNGGEIDLEGGSGATNVSGTLTATASKGTGGTIAVTGHAVTLTQTAQIDASGATGGTVAVGGGVHGGAVLGITSLTQAQAVTVAPGAGIAADGSAGAGGTISVWTAANDGSSVTRVGGALSATGATVGGFIETSGDGLNIDGIRVDAKGGSGRDGTWLLDPYELDLDAAAAGSIEAALATASVTIVTTATGSSSGYGVTNNAGTDSLGGDIVVQSAITWSSANTLSLSANNSVVIDAPITITGAGTLALTTTNGSLSVGASVSFTGSGGALSINGAGYSLISTAAELDGITVLSGDYALATDIDASGIANFTPIGSTASPFTGKFEGLDHTISNLTLADSTNAVVGLFPQLGTGGEIADLQIVGASISASASGEEVGGLVGRNDGLIIDVSFAGSVTTSDTGGAAVGGIAGVNLGQIADVSTAGSISSPGDLGPLGGIVGSNGLDLILSASLTSAYVYDSYSTATVSATAGLGYVGGLVGGNHATIDASYFAGIASNTTETLGGLVGTNFSPGIVENSYDIGSLTGSSVAAGGLVGLNMSGASVTNSYAAGLIAATGTVGGLVGENQGTLTSSVWDNTAAGTSQGAAIGATVGGSYFTAGLTAVSGYSDSGYSLIGTTGTTLGDTWYWVAGYMRPILESEYSHTIRNAHQLELINLSLAGVYTLDRNLDASATGTGTGIWAATGFVPIGFNATAGAFNSLPSAFTGSLDGQGYAITGLSITLTSDNDVGLFSDIGSGGRVSNLSLSGSAAGINNQLHNVNGEGTGLLAGQNGGTIANVVAFVANGATDLVQGDWYVGGLVGVNSGIIIDSGATVPVTGLASVGNLGGLVGDNAGTIEASYAEGAVSVPNGSPSSIGGLAGTNEAGATIVDAYALGDVTGPVNTVVIGGLVGENIGLIASSFATGAVTVGGTSDSIGGLVGEAGGGTVANSYSTGVVTASSANGDTNFSNFIGLNSGTTIGGGATSLAALEASLPAGFSAVVWTDGIGQITPYLIANAGPAYVGATQLQPLTTAAQLLAIGLTGDYYLANDIDLSSIANFTPIGFNSAGSNSAPSAFTGILDGIGFSISNLTISLADDNLGLISEIGASGIVENLQLVNGHVTATGGVSNIGMLTGELVGLATNVGVVGGTVSGGSDTGGFVGINAGTITGSYASASVTGATAVGGFVGANSLSIADSYALGGVSGSVLVGGFVGLNSGTIIDSFETGVATGSNNFGGFAGGSTRSLSNVYWTTDTAGQALEGDGTNVTDAGLSGISLATLEGSLPSGFSGGTWGDAGGLTTPYLLGNFGPVYVSGQTPLFSGVGTAAQLQAMTPTGDYAIEGNIDASAIANFTPIGFSTADTNMTPTQFTGILDGLSFAISGLTISDTIDNNLGLISEIGAAGVFENLTVTGVVAGSTGAAVLGAGLITGENFGTIANVAVTATVNGYNEVGALAGRNQGTISASTASGTVGGLQDIGGLVGQNLGGTINTSTASTTVGVGLTGTSNLGGLVGANTSGGLIESSSASGSVGGAGASAVGGLVGVNLASTIISSFASGQVTGTTAVGGLVGQNAPGGEISASSAFNTVIGVIAGLNNDFGGLVGDNFGSILNSSVTSGFSVGFSGGFQSAAVAMGGLVGLNESTGTITTAAVEFGDSVGGTSTDSSDIAAIYDIGGFVGLNQGLIAAPAGAPSWSEATVAYAGASLDTASVGGFVGLNEGGTIVGAYALGSVDGGSAGTFNSNGQWVDVGGFAGNNLGVSSTIDQAYAAGFSVSGGYYLGGFVGSNNGGVITNSYALGSVIGSVGLTAYAGGFVGANQGAASIDAAYETGAVTSASASNYGGFAGFNGGGLTNAYYTDTNTGIANGSGTVTSLTLAALEAAIPSGFDFGIWTDFSGKTTPTLLNNLGVVYSVYDGGTQLSPISSLAGLQALSLAAGGGFYLTQNISAVGLITPISIGDGLRVLDGLGFDISGMSIVTAVGGNEGLFADLVGAVENLSITSSTVTVASNALDVGILAGSLYSGNGTILNVALIGDSINDTNGPNASAQYVGLLAGAVSGNVSGLRIQSDTISLTQSSALLGLGGVAGTSNALLVNVTVSGTAISVTNTAAPIGLFALGGIVGGNEGSIRGAAFTGNSSIAYSGAGNSLDIGGVAGLNDVESEIDGSSAEGSISVTDSASNFTLNVGGFVGENDAVIGETVSTLRSTPWANVSITATATASGVGTSLDVGGFVGLNASGDTISLGGAEGSVTVVNGSGSGGTGGFVGVNYGAIQQSWAAGSVSGGQYVGGFVGRNFDFGSTGLTSISDSYAFGDVGGSAAASDYGGFVGLNDADGTIIDTFATGLVTATAGTIGAFAGSNNTSGFAEISAAYWMSHGGAGPAFAVGDNSLSTVASALTLAQLQSGVPAGFNPDLWTNTGGATPYLNQNNGPAYLSALGSGTYYDVIDTPSAFQNIHDTGNYIVVTGLDFSGSGDFTPIANFDGTLSGLGPVTLSNITIDDVLTDPSGFNASGLFRQVGAFAPASIGDLVLVNENLTVTYTGTQGVYEGGVVGHLIDGSLINVSVSGTISGSGISDLGGLVGAIGLPASADIGFLAFDASTATISLNSNNAAVGGLVGEMGFSGTGTIDESYAAGTITTSFIPTAIGGLVGALVSGNPALTISNSYALETISTGSNVSGSHIGGLVGQSDDGTIIDSYAGGPISGGATNGGLIGGAAVGSPTIVISNSDWITDTTGQAASPGGTGLSLATFAASLPTGWDTTIWGGGDGVTPYLRANAGPVYGSGHATTQFTPITTTAQFEAIGTIGDDYLAANLNFASFSYTPISNFGGILEGAGNTISNVSLSDSSDLLVGLFGEIGGTVEGLSITGSTITVTSGGSGQFAGILAGYVGGTVSNVTLSGDTLVDNGYGGSGDAAGGMAGTLGLGASLDTVTATGIGVSADTQYLGGLVGIALGAISNVTVTSSTVAYAGNVSGVNADVGGVVGYLATGDVPATLSIASAIETTVSALTSVAGNTLNLGGVVGDAAGLVSQADVDGTTVAMTDSVGISTIRIGGIVGFLESTGSLTASTVPAVEISAFISVAGDNLAAGGAVGDDGGTISSTFSFGTLSLTNSTTGNSNFIDAGGLVGDEESSGLIFQSDANTTVSVSAPAGSDGGLVGANHGGSIDQSYAAGQVSGVSFVGGFVGDNAGTITNSFATGAVLGGSGTVGGFVGLNDTAGNIAASYATDDVPIGAGAFAGTNSGTIGTSYFDWETAGLGSAANGFGATALTTAQFENGGATALAASPWTSLANTSFPYLTWQVSGAVEVIQGTVSGTAAGIPVALANGGLDSAIQSALGGATTYTGANGFYYFLVSTTNVPSGTTVVAYLLGDAPAAAIAEHLTGSIPNFDITVGGTVQPSVTVYNNTDTSLSGVYTTLGGLLHSGFSVPSVSGVSAFSTDGSGNFSIGAGGGLAVVNSAATFSVDSTYTGNSDLTIDAIGTNELVTVPGLTIVSGFGLAINGAATTELTGPYLLEGGIIPAASLSVGTYSTTAFTGSLTTYTPGTIDLVGATSLQSDAALSLTGFNLSLGSAISGTGAVSINSYNSMSVATDIDAGTLQIAIYSLADTFTDTAIVSTPSLTLGGGSFVLSNAANAIGRVGGIGSLFDDATAVSVIDDYASGLSIASLNASGSLFVRNTGGAITVAGAIGAAGTLELDAATSIALDAQVDLGSSGAVILRADQNLSGLSTNTITEDTGGPAIDTTGAVTIDYRPASYSSPSSFSGFATNTLLGAYMTVDNAADFGNLASNLAGDYVLNTDLSLSGSLAPIGSVATPFTGFLEGNSHTISGLSISVAGGSDVGLFAAVGSTGVVQDLTISNGSVFGLDSVGLVAGLNQGLISNINAVGGTVTGYNDVGSMVGVNQGTLTSLTSSATVNGGVGQSVGAIAGANTGTIISAGFSGSVAQDEVLLTGTTNTSLTNSAPISGETVTLVIDDSGLGSASLTGATSFQILYNDTGLPSSGEVAAYLSGGSIKGAVLVDGLTVNTATVSLPGLYGGTIAISTSGSSLSGAIGSLSAEISDAGLSSQLGAGSIATAVGTQNLTINASGGSFALDESINLGAGTLQLTTTAGMTQTAGSITAGSVDLEGSAVAGYALGQTGNAIAALSGATFGSVSLVDSVGLTIYNSFAGALTVSDTGAISIPGALFLGGNTSLTGSSVDFGSTVDGNLSLTVSGNVSFGGTVGGATALASLTVIDTGSLIDSNGINATSVSLGGAGGIYVLSGTNSIGSLTATTGSVSLAYSDLPLTLEASSLTSGLSLSGSGALSLAGNITTAGGPVDLNSSSLASGIALTNSVTIDTTNGGASAGGAITLGTLDDGNSAGTDTLTLKAGTAAISLGAVGDSAALAGLTATAATVTAGDIAANTLTLDQTGSFSDSSAITATALSLQGTGSYALTGTSNLIDSLSGLGGGVTLVDGTALTLAGGATAGGVSINDANGITLSGNVTTSAGQSYSGSVALGASVSLADALTHGVAFSSRIDGAQSLTISASTISFGGAVGSLTALSGLTLVDSGSLSDGFEISTSALSLEGGGSYSLTNSANRFASLAVSAGAVTLDDSVSLLLPAVSLTGALAITDTAVLSLDGNVTTAGGSVSLSGQSGIVLLTSATIGTSGGAITLGTLNDGNGAGTDSLTLNAGSAGAVSLGTVGSTTALGGLTATGATITAGIIAANTLTLNQSGSFSDASNVTATTLSLQGTGTYALSGAGNQIGSLASAGGGVSLVDANALTVAALTTAGGVSLTEGVATTLTGNIVTAAGQSYSGPVSLAAAVDLTGSAVAFGSTVTGPFALTVSGPVTLGGNVTTTGAAQDYTGAVSLAAAVDLTGSAVTFGSTVTGSSALTVSGPATLGGNVTTTGAAQDYTGPVSLAAAVDLTGSAVTFGSTVTGSSALTVSGPVTLGGNVTTTGAAQDYTGPVSLAAAVDLTSSAVTFGSTVTGPFTLTVSGPLTLGGNVTTAGAAQDYTGAVSLAAAVDLTGASVTFGSTVAGSSALTVSGPVTLGGNVTTTGAAQDYTGPVSLAAAVDLTGSAVTFGSTVMGSSALTISGPVTLGGNVTTTGAAQDYTGAVSLAAAVDLTGSAVTFASTVTGPFALTVSGPLTLGGNVTTTGAAQDYTGAVSLAAAVDLTGSAVTFGSTLNGAHALTVNGGVTFSGAVGSTAALTSLNLVTDSLTVSGTVAAGAVTIGTIGGGGTINIGTPGATQTLELTAATLAAFGATAPVTIGDSAATVNVSGPLANMPNTLVLDALNVSLDSTVQATSGNFATLTVNLAPGGSFDEAAGASVTFMGGVSIAPTSGSATITIDGALDPTSGITLNAGSGSVALGAAASLTSSGGTITIIGSALTIANSVSVNANTVALNSSNSTLQIGGSGTGTLILTSADLAALAGGTLGTNSLTIGGTGTTVTITGSVVLPSNVTVIGSSVTASSATVSAAILAIDTDSLTTTGSTTVAATTGLSIDTSSGTGTIQVGSGTSGGTLNLTTSTLSAFLTPVLTLGSANDSLTVVGNATISPNATVNVAAGLTTITSGATIDGHYIVNTVTVNGTVFLGGATTIDTSGANGTISVQDIEGTGSGGQTLVIDAGSGNVSIGTIGGSVAIGAAAITTTGTLTLGSVTTTGVQGYSAGSIGFNSGALLTGTGIVFATNSIGTPAGVSANTVVLTTEAGGGTIGIGNDITGAAPILAVSQSALSALGQSPLTIGDANAAITVYDNTVSGAASGVTLPASLTLNGATVSFASATGMTAAGTLAIATDALSFNGSASPLNVQNGGSVTVTTAAPDGSIFIGLTGSGLQLSQSTIADLGSGPVIIGDSTANISQGLQLPSNVTLVDASFTSFLNSLQLSGSAFAGYGSSSFLANASLRIDLDGQIYTTTTNASGVYTVNISTAATGHHDLVLLLTSGGIGSALYDFTGSTLSGLNVFGNTVYIATDGTSVATAIGNLATELAQLTSGSGISAAGLSAFSASGIATTGATLAIAGTGGSATTLSLDVATTVGTNPAASTLILAGSSTLVEGSSAIVDNTVEFDGPGTFVLANSGNQITNIAGAGAGAGASGSFGNAAVEDSTAVTLGSLQATGALAIADNTVGIGGGATVRTGLGLVLDTFTAGGTIGVGNSTGTLTLSSSLLAALGANSDVLVGDGTNAIAASGNVTVGNGLTVDGTVTLYAATNIQAGSGPIAFLGSVNAQQGGGAVVATNAGLTLGTSGNIYFGASVGTAVRDSNGNIVSTALYLPSLTITQADNVTVNPSQLLDGNGNPIVDGFGKPVYAGLYVHSFTGKNIAGMLSLGQHSLESDGDVAIFATAVDGRIVAGNSASINAGSITNSNVTAVSTIQVAANDVTNSTFTSTRSADITAGQSITGSTITTGVANITASSITTTTVNANSATATANSYTADSFNTATAPKLNGGDPTVGGNTFNGQPVTSAVVQLASLTVPTNATNPKVSNGSGGDVSDSGNGGDSNDKKKKGGKNGVEKTAAGGTKTYDYANQYVDKLLNRGKPTAP